ncbi:MAG TPA: hypothetical protein VLT33_34055 [Labilithrix sp.]|nr:hypothetical protein [Labilithrix sp.]
MSAYRVGEPCPKCRDGSTTSEGECLKCGALWGAVFRCPHCSQHTKPVIAPLVRAACSACAKPRLGADLPKEAYDVILSKLRVYRMWHARALVYVPVAALGLAVIAAGSSFYLRTSALAARDNFIAEHGPGASAPSSLALALPDPSTAFLVGLVLVGMLGVAVYVGVAVVLRQRVGHEAARLEAAARAGTAQRAS